MLSFTLRRLGMLLITMVALSMVIFVLSEVVPIDPALKILGRASTPDARASRAHQRDRGDGLGPRAPGAPPGSALSHGCCPARAAECADRAYRPYHPADEPAQRRLDRHRAVVQLSRPGRSVRQRRPRQ